MSDMPVEPTIESLSNFIVERTKQAWEHTRQPYLLSFISPDLKEHNVDYRQIIFPENLKSFVKNNLKDRIEIVEHPLQRAKIGLIPLGETFSFTAPTTRSNVSFSIKGTNDSSSYAHPDENKQALLNFLDALGKLSPEEADSVKIPTTVLIKLLHGK